MVRLSPSLSGVFGGQFSTVRACEMSGRRWRGSSSGFGRCTMREREPVISITSEASCSIENSSGLPMLIGPVTVSGVSISRIRPSIRSST